MMKKLLTIAAGLAAMGAVSAANAADINFGQAAVGNEHIIGNGDIENIGGVNIQFFSNYNAYLDDFFQGRPGGLGVCSTGPDPDDADECAVPSDDNIGDAVNGAEWVKIVFADGPRDILDIAFRDSEHNVLTSSDTGLLDYAV